MVNRVISVPKFFFILCLALALGMVAIGHADHITSAQSDAAAIWNAHRRAVACQKDNGSKVVCDPAVGGKDAQDHPPSIPQGWRTVFYTHGCAHCAVGWVLVPGERCGPKDLNCMD